jgi:hypothetical protein
MGYESGLSRCKVRYNTCQRLGDDKFCFFQGDTITEDEAKDYCKVCAGYVQGKWRGKE